MLMISTRYYSSVAKQHHFYVENEEAVSKKYFKAWHVKKGLRKAQERLGETDEEEELLGSESGSGTMSPQSDV